MKNVKIVKNKAFVGESKLSFLSGRHYNNFIKTYAGKTIKFNGILYCVNIVKLDYEVEEFYFEPLFSLGNSTLRKSIPIKRFNVPPFLFDILI
jgi:hypothetical protein